MKLSVKISLLQGIVILAITIAMFAVVGFKVRSIMEKFCLDSLSNSADANANFLKSKLEGELEILAEMATRLRVRSMDWNIVQPTLKADVHRLGLLDLAMVNPEGISHYVLGNTTVDVRDRAYFKRAMSGEKNIEIVINRLDGKVVALLAVPIKKTEDMNSPVAGVLIARKDGLTDIKSSYAFLTDTEGTIIAHKDQELITKQFNSIKKVKKDPSLKFFEYSYKGKTFIGTYSDLQGYPWKYFLTIEKQEIENELSQISTIMLWIGFICFIVGIISATIVGRSIANPIVRMVDALKDITQGDGDLTKSIPVQSRDETGDLARYFNKFTDTLRGPIGEAKTIVDHLVSVSKDLSLVSKRLASNSEKNVNQGNTIASSTEEMAMNINAMASGAEQASVSTNEVANATEEMAANIRTMSSEAKQASANASEVAGAAEQISTNINTISAAVEEMSSSIRQIAGNASDAHKITENAITKSGEATKVMDKLGLAAKEIGKVTDVIKKIADKTNLLALNATIEAASAGEAGKGFTVVAGEIKELANQSASSADDIARKIQSIQVDTNEAVAVINEVSEIITHINQSVEAIAGHVEQQTKASNEIASNVAQTNTGAKRVASAISEVARGTKEIARNVTQASTSAKRVVSAIGEVAKGANDVSRNASEAAKGVHNVSSNISDLNYTAKENSQGASQVNQNADKLSQMAKQLRTAMDKFKV